MPSRPLDAAPVLNATEAFRSEVLRMSLQMSRSTAPVGSSNIASLIQCVGCDHISDDHRHDDAHACPTDPRVADREMCPHRCTAVGCDCADMAWSKRDLLYDKKIAQMQAQVAMLTDSVVGAVGLVFGEINDISERDEMTEELYQLREDLIAANPRLQAAEPEEQ